MLAMISCSAARSTSVTKSLRPLEAMVSDSRRFMLRTITSPARRAARTAILSSGCMIAVDHSNANGALPIHVRTARRACAHNPDDRPDVLQCHQLIDLEADAELALETAREGRVPERVPLLNVIRLGIERQRARIQIEGALESVLYARQIKVRH